MIKITRAVVFCPMKTNSKLLLAAGGWPRGNSHSEEVQTRNWYYCSWSTDLLVTYDIGVDYQT
jgi:hypothetical protein